MAATQAQTDMASVERIRKALDEQGRKIQWLADQIGYNPGHVGRVLNGQLPVTRGFIVLAEQALGIQNQKIA